MTSRRRKPAGKTAKRVRRGAKPATRPHDPVAWLKSEDDIAYYLEAIVEDGDPRVLTLGLRNAARAIGGMAELARRSGLSRETLYRTLSEDGNPRLDTLARLLAAFDLRLSVTRRVA